MSNSILVEEGGGVVVQIEDGATVLESQDGSARVLVEEAAPAIIDQSDYAQVVVSDNEATVLDILYVLPTETLPEEEQVYAKRTDFENDDTVIYRGEAAVGTLDSEPLWRIRRLTIAADDDVTEEWANGNANFTNVWDNRAALTYT